MPFRFVHAADIHLDSPLRSLALRNPLLGELVGTATRRAFEATVDLCLEEKVDALILAGDLYDGEQTSMKTARFLATQLKKLQDAGVRTFVIRGNHDALSKITKELVLPDTAKIFGARAEAIEVTGADGGPAVTIHGISFAQPHAPDSLLPRYRPPVEGSVNIGLMHTSLGDTKPHSPYAPCKATDLQASGFRYWALGHIHARGVTEGACTIVMPGMPQGRDIGESGPKSVALVTVGDDASITVEERRTCVAQFERVQVDVGGVSEWRDLVRRIADELGRARDEVGAEHLIARVALRGTTPLAWRIRRDADLVRTQAEERAESLERTWIDKVELDVAVPGAADHGAGALDDLRRLIRDEVTPSIAYTLGMTAIIEELSSQLPPECRHVLGSDEAGQKAVLAKLALDGSETVLARLEERMSEDA